MNIPVLRWGILGTGNIAGKFATDLGKLGGRAILAAVGSRSRPKAVEFAERHQAWRGYPGYQQVLDDPEVDAVYISLPNQEHCRWSLAASAAGKHVLCEKPAGMTAVEVEAMTAAAAQAGTLWLEAFAYRCHPRYARLAELLNNDAIGRPRLAQASFCFDGRALGRPRLWDPAMGGGALMDVGVYPLSLLRLIARFCGDDTPTAISATGDIVGGVDHCSAGTLRFPSGLIATWQTAISVQAPSIAHIFGDAGSIEIRAPWRCDEPTFIIRRPGQADEVVIVDDGEPLYGREALTVARFAGVGQAPACTWADSIAQAQLLDAIRAQLGVEWPVNS